MARKRTTPLRPITIGSEKRFIPQNDLTISIGVDLDTGYPIVEVKLPNNPTAFSPAELILFIKQLQEAFHRAAERANPELYRRMFQ